MPVFCGGCAVTRAPCALAAGSHPAAIPAVQHWGNSMELQPGAGWQQWESRDGENQLSPGCAGSQTCAGSCCHFPAPLWGCAAACAAASTTPACIHSLPACFSWLPLNSAAHPAGPSRCEGGRGHRGFLGGADGAGAGQRGGGCRGGRAPGLALGRPGCSGSGSRAVGS